MAQIYDLSGLMNEEKPSIQFGDRKITVNNGSLAMARYEEYQENMKLEYKQQMNIYKKAHPKATVDEITASIVQANPLDEFKKIISIFLKEDDVNFIMGLDLSAEGLQKVLITILAAANNKTVEEMESQIDENKGKKKAK